MADIFSNIYFSYAIKFSHKNDNISKKLTDYCLDRLYNENQLTINRVIDNLNGNFYFAKILLYHLKGNQKTIQYSKTSDLIKELKNNNKILEKIKENIYTKDTILEELEKLTEMKNHLNYASNTQFEDSYKKLYNKVIQVEEFDNIKINNMERWENYEKNMKDNCVKK